MKRREFIKFSASLTLAGATPWANSAQPLQAKRLLVIMLRGGMDGDYFSQRKSKLDRRLKTALGPAAEHYRIHDGGTRPGKYSLTLPPGSIRFLADVASREEI